MRGVTNYCSLGCGWIYNCKNIGTFYAPSNILWTDTDTSWYNVGNSNAQFIANLPNAGRAESWFNANVKIGGGGNNWTFSWAKS
jgi:hypothetical protein